MIRKYPYGVFNTIIECFCNGSLDTSVYLNCEDEDYAALNIIKEKSDIFDYLENNIGLEFLKGGLTNEYLR